jgi:hypothetical protein
VEWRKGTARSMRLVWVAHVGLVVGNAAALLYTIVVVRLYRLLLSDKALEIGLNQLDANTQTFVRPVIVLFTVISVVHSLVLLYSLFWNRRLIDGFATILWRPNTTRIYPFDYHVSPSYLQIAGDKLARGCTFVTTACSTYNTDLTRVLVLFEVALQTFQAYKISYLVASVSLNRSVALVVVTNCWSSPILYYVVGSRLEAHARLGHHFLDASLHLIYSIAIPLAIFYPYYRDYDGTISLFPIIFYYDDTWYANAVSELRQVFVTSLLDFISKGSASFSLVYRLWRAKTTVDNVCKDVVTARSTSTEANVTTSTKSKRSRLTRFLDVVLVVWGAAILSLHLTTTIASFRMYDPDCLLEMRPWGSLAYACASYEISCSKRRTNGDGETMGTILTKVDPLSVQNLIISNCPHLHVPSAIQKLKYLTMMKIYNSTIVLWDADAALRQEYHPQLQMIFLARVNASGIPEGMLSEDFPRSVWDIELCITNISIFPSTVRTAWVNVGSIVHEGNPNMTEYPEVLTTLPNVFALFFGMNSIKTFQDDVLESLQLLSMGMNGNPIHKLPTSVGSIGQLAFLNFVGTKITAIPAAWMDIKVPTSKQADSATLHAAGSPLCAPNEAPSVLMKPSWLRINCEMPTDGLYEYPIAAEDAWRHVNQ